MDRLLLLLPTTTYRTQDFLEAARTLGVDLVCASERPNTLEARLPDHFLTVDFTDPDGAAATVAAFSRSTPLRAVVGVDDVTAVAAAAIAERLGLTSSAVAAVATARDKFQMRECLAAAGVPIPRYRRLALKDDPFLAARGVGFPCVLKPLTLSASRGVIRANNVDQFIAAFRRIAALPCPTRCSDEYVTSRPRRARPSDWPKAPSTPSCASTTSDPGSSRSRRARSAVCALAPCASAPACRWKSSSCATRSAGPSPRSTVSEARPVS